MLKLIPQLQATCHNIVLYKQELIKELLESK